MSPEQQDAALDAFLATIPRLSPQEEAARVERAQRENPEWFEGWSTNLAALDGVAPATEFEDPATGARQTADRFIAEIQSMPQEAPPPVPSRVAPLAFVRPPPTFAAGLAEPQLGAPPGLNAPAPPEATDYRPDEMDPLMFALAMNPAVSVPGSENLQRGFQNVQALKQLSLQDAQFASAQQQRRDTEVFRQQSADARQVQSIGAQGDIARYQSRHAAYRERLRGIQAARVAEAQLANVPPEKESDRLRRVGMFNDESKEITGHLSTARLFKDHERELAELKRLGGPMLSTSSDFTSRALASALRGGSNLTGTNREFLTRLEAFRNKLRTFAQNVAGRDAAGGGQITNFEQKFISVVEEEGVFAGTEYLKRVLHDIAVQARVPKLRDGLTRMRRIGAEEYRSFLETHGGDIEQLVTDIAVEEARRAGDLGPQPGMNRDEVVKAYRDRIEAHRELLLPAELLTPPSTAAQGAGRGISLTQDPMSAQPRSYTPEQTQALAGAIQRVPRSVVEPEMLYAVAEVESNAGQNLVNSKGSGALGPFQFIPSTAQRLGLQDPMDPIESTQAAARLFADNKRQLGGNEFLALAAHHKGAAAIRKVMQRESKLANQAAMSNTPEERRTAALAIVDKLERSSYGENTGTWLRNVLARYDTVKAKGVFR